MGFYLDVGLPANVPAKFELCIALPVPEIIAIEVLGGVANRGVHGNGIPRGNGIPMGFPWEWE